MPETAQQFSAVNDNLLVIVGRLLEATKAAADGIKTLSEETKANSAAVAVANEAMSSLRTTVGELDRIVRTSTADSLVVQVRELVNEVKALRRDVTEAEDADTVSGKRIDNLEHDHSTVSGGKKMLGWVLMGLAWAITTAIAIVALFHK